MEVNARELDYATADGGGGSAKKPVWCYGATLGMLVGCLFLTRWIAVQVITDWHRFLPRVLGNELFFLHQRVFPYKYLAARWTGGASSPAVAVVCSVIQWGAVAAGLLWLTRRVRLVYVLALVPVVIVAVAHVVPEVMTWFGAPFCLDGP